MDSDSNYKFRIVVDKDCDLIFKWANDKDVRKNSFNSNLIKYEEHIKWFSKKLEAEDDLVYIFSTNQLDVGMIRLDKIDNYSYLINYSIAKEHRGKGYATELLRLIKDKYRTSLLIGKVKSTNIGSIKAFLNAGYLMNSKSDIKIFYSSDKTKFERKKENYV